MLAEAEDMNKLEDAAETNGSRTKKKGNKAAIKRTKKKKKTSNQDGYETDHQDYCEVCQQGGEIILCDTCPRAYHLVCLEPELETAPEGKWSCPSCEADGVKEKEEEEQQKNEFCKICKENSDLINCDTCPNSYHMWCLNPPLFESPAAGDWTCHRCACDQLPGKVQKLLFWRFVDGPKPPENWKESVGDEKADKYNLRQLREFLVKWADMSFWHCSWISEMQLEVFHPQMLRSYFKKCDPDEAPVPGMDDDDDVASSSRRLKKANLDVDPNSLEERFYKYGIKSTWLKIHRIINHRTLKDGTTQYLVKWRDLAYDQATWEDEDEDIDGIKVAIDYYQDLRASCNADGVSSRGVKKGKKKSKSRCRELGEEEREPSSPRRYTSPPDKPVTNLNRKWEVQPEYIEVTNMSLHPYQLEGVNWLR